MILTLGDLVEIYIFYPVGPGYYTLPFKLTYANSQFLMINLLVIETYYSLICLYWPTFKVSITPSELSHKIHDKG